MHDCSLFINATHENGLESFLFLLNNLQSFETQIIIQNSRIWDGPNSSKHGILRR